MVIEKGEIVHIIVRRAFENDVTRHFVGTIVSEGQGPLFRIQGYTFVLDAASNRYVKRPERRTRIFSFIDGRNIINVLPASVDINKIHYGTSKEGHLVVTDGLTFSLDINEFKVR